MRRCITAGFFSNAARLLPNGNYRTVKDGREVAVHPSSVVYRFGHAPEWVVFHDVILTTQEFIRCGAQQRWRHARRILSRAPRAVTRRELVEVKSPWLTELASHFYEVTERKAATRSDLKRAREGGAAAAEEEPFYKRLTF